MKEFPSEILGEIFLYLHPKDKVDCMLVCQHWKQVIETFALYHALDIRSEASLYKLNSMVKDNPDVGKRVEHLMVSVSVKTDDFDLNRFLLLFPNIRTLLCTNTRGTPLIRRDNIFFPWNKHIEYIYEYSRGLITYSLLLFNTCPDLTTIDLGDLHVYIIPLLENAPALKNLTLRNGSITFDDLDSIHENALCLESFTGCRLTLEDSELSQNMSSAISVTEFRFDELAVESLETRKKLLVYASKKYPNLSNFTCTFFPVSSNDDGIEKLTESDWFPLLQNVGSQLKKLSLCNHGWVDNTFEILDKFNCQIECFNIRALTNAEFLKIVQSDQVFYIQTLSVDLIDFEAFDWLNDLQKLKKLELSRSSYIKRRTGIDLNTILNNSPPTLRSSSLHNVRLAAYPEFTTLSNIESLSFNQIKIPKGIDTFISQCFPKLSNLKLTKCDVIGGVFNLEKMDLLNFSYTTQFIMGGIADILIVTFANNERRWYDIRAGDGTIGFRSDILLNSFHSSVKSRPQNRTDTEPYFTLLCNSLNNSTFT